VFLTRTGAGLVGIFYVGNLVVRYIIMKQSECGRDKMAGTIAAICLLILVVPACRGGLPQDEKYSTRSVFHTYK
jgi:hypothetical protein